MQTNQMNDNDLINFYRNEFGKEWLAAQKSGVRLTAADIRLRLSDLK